MLLLEVFLFSWACLFLVRRLSFVLRTFVLSCFRAFVLFSLECMVVPCEQITTCLGLAPSLRSG